MAAETPESAHERRAAGRKKQADAIRGRPQTDEHKRKRVEEIKRRLAAKRYVCVECGAEYTPTNPAQKYCSDACYKRVKARKRAASRPRALAAAAAHKKQADAIRGRPQSDEHKRQRAEATARRMAETIRVCRECGAEFTPTQPAQRYCSGRCWTAANRRTTRKDTAGSRPPALSKDAYQALLEQQGGVCAICGVLSGSNGRGDRLAIDHDHATGRIRGLLCHRCNTALGLLKDDPVRLQRALDYLKS